MPQSPTPDLRKNNRCSPSDWKSLQVLYVSDKDMKVISTLTTFFQVFYANQCYARYLGCYNLTRRLLLQMHRFAFVLRIAFNKPELKSNLRMAMRYMIASNLLFFFELNREVSDVEWDELVGKELLNEEERDFLVNFNRRKKGQEG
jgi:hypothetical protein